MARNESTLRKALSRLFSSSVVVRNVGGKKLKVADTGQLQQTSLGNRNRGRYSYGGGYRGIGGGLGFGAYGGGQGTDYGFNSQRYLLFNDYERMDQDPIISAALDIYADESVVTNEHNELLRIKTEDGEVKEILKNLYYDILNLESNLRWWTRSVAKYGDMFLKLDISPEYGVINAQPLSPYEIQRVEGEDPENPYEIGFRVMDFGGGFGAGRGPHTGGTGANELDFEFWEIAHFRFVTDGNYLPYGKSLIEGARREWKRLTLMEDAMMIHRIMRAPEKRAFYIDVGNLEPEAIEPYMNSVIAEMKKAPLMDPETGEYNLQFNLQNMLDDFFFPVRGRDGGTKVESLPQFRLDAMEDIEYLRTKMMTALKVPNAFLGFERDLQGKATLSQESMLFSHIVKNLQKVMVAELKKIGIIHLFSQGIEDARMVQWDIELANPSTILEQEYLDIISTKVNLARSLNDNNLFSTEWIYKNLFHLSEDEISEQRNERLRDWKRKFRAEQIEREGNDPVKTGQSFGTPSDLALSGSPFVKPLSLEQEKEEQEELEHFEKVKGDIEDRKKKNYGIPSGDEDKPSQTDLRPNFRGGPLSLDHIRKAKGPQIILESMDNNNLSDADDEALEGTYLDPDKYDEINERIKRMNEHMP